MQILYNSEEQITKMILDKQKGKLFFVHSGFFFIFIFSIIFSRKIIINDN